MLETHTPSNHTHTVHNTAAYTPHRQQRSFKNLYSRTYRPNALADVTLNKRNAVYILAKNFWNTGVRPLLLPLTPICKDSVTRPSLTAFFNGPYKQARTPQHRWSYLYKRHTSSMHHTYPNGHAWGHKFSTYPRVEDVLSPVSCFCVLHTTILIC